MHPSEAPANVALPLWMGNCSINPRIYLRAHVRTVTGATATGLPIFGAGYAEYEWEVTSALLGYPTIDIQRPRYPMDGEFFTRAVECSFDLASEGGKIAATQTDAVIRRGDLEQARVIFRAEVNGQIIDWFSGRVSGMPREKAGVTTLTVMGYFWEAIRKPVYYENFGNVYDGIKSTSQQATYANSGFRATAAKIPCIGTDFCAHHGITAFDGGGRAFPNVSQTDGAGIALTQIDLKNGIKIGKYTIKFLDSKNYTLTYPDGQTFAGVINGLFGYTVNNLSGVPQYTLVGDVGIRPEYWQGNDGTGGVLEILVSWSAVGNPVAIAFNLIEKALLDNWGAIPTAAAWMDVVKWQEAARRFESFTVHVDATNTDNAVWEDYANNVPLSVAQLAQRILDHVGCALTLTIDGQISLSIPYIDDEPMYPHSTEDTVLGDGITIEASGEQVNYLQCSYAWNGDSYGAAVAPIDLRIGTAQKVAKTISFAYFKAGIGARLAEWAARTYARRFMGFQSTVTYKVHGGIGLLLQVGDRVTVVSETLPRLEKIVEIFDIGKSLGPDEADVKAQIIQDREGPKCELCTVVVGGAEIW